MIIVPEDSPVVPATSHRNRKCGRGQWGLAKGGFKILE